MTSRLGQKAVGVAAIVAIILLIVLIVLLWTGVGAGVFSTRNSVGKSLQSKPHRNEEISTLLTDIDIVTSSATLLNDKVEDYMRGS
ncbi:hypothetical protein L9F63_007912, partial [Diploptera punctata]